MSIQILSDELVSQIAAGEVVERAASVVKELIENAIDAHASEISVRIEDAGKRLIEVSDNGSGISKAELALAVQRHATSKLQRADDLFRIATLGFRGEALASIAAISRFVVTSKQEGADTGGKIMVDGGRVLSVEETGVPQGTVVHVEDLFYNVPARLAFLKSPATEKNHINDLVYRYALAYPQVRWSLYQDHRPVLRSSGNGNRREILASMYGISISKEMIEVNLEENSYQVFGFISPADITRSNRREMTFFVNGRWVQDVGLSAALYKSYDNYLPPGRYPIAALFIELPPNVIDVNVHPAKAEVRFSDPQVVFSLVQRAVRRAFLAFTPMNSEATNWTCRDGGMAGQRWNPSAMPQSHMIDPAWQMAADLRNEGDAATEKFAYQAEILPEAKGLLRLIGKMQQGYLLVEGPDGLYLIDERAAKERVFYEAMLREVEAGGVRSEELPEAVTLSYSGNPEQLAAAFQTVGCFLESFGIDLVKFTHVPALFSSLDVKSILTALLAEELNRRFGVEEEKTEFLMKRLVHHASLAFSSGNDRNAQNQLISELQACQSPRQTPDGHATMIHLSLDFMSRQFGRG